VGDDGKIPPFLYRLLDFRHDGLNFGHGFWRRSIRNMGRELALDSLVK
jgi:hypothetical protein